MAIIVIQAVTVEIDERTENTGEEYLGDIQCKYVVSREEKTE